MLLKRKNKKIKIFVVSIVILENYHYKITFFLDKKLENQYFKGLFQFSITTNNVELMQKLKIGEWVGVDLDDMGSILCVFN